MLEKFFITCNAENHWTLDATRADDKIIFLRDEYEKFWRKILRGENFALARYADGEHNLMLGYKMNNIDGWTSPGQTALGAALRDSLTIDAPNYYYGNFQRDVLEYLGWRELQDVCRKLFAAGVRRRTYHKLAREGKNFRTAPRQETLFRKR
ncbi:MAG: hypothetical protein SR1Q7_01905 [Quinella sp. 1Q7]|nr:hypothetical protein [Quinella sp. 1Q7]